MDDYRLPALRRDLYLRIVDNYTDVHSITMRLHFLDNHFPPEKIIDALKWLTNNGIVGRVFVSWFTHVCSASDLEMHRLLLQVVDNQRKLGAVVAGKNFRV